MGDHGARASNWPACKRCGQPLSTDELKALMSRTPGRHDFSCAGCGAWTTYNTERFLRGSTRIYRRDIPRGRA